MDSIMSSTQEAALQGFRLSPQQRRLWFLLGSDPASHHSLLVLRIEGAVDILQLRNVLERLVSRNEILRTDFVQPSGVRLPIQVVRAEAEVSIEDGSPGDSTPRKGEVKPEPPLRVWLSGPSSGGRLLSLSLSPLIMDAKGLLILAEDLALSYEACLEGPEPAQYPDLSQWLNDLLEDEDTALGRRHWEERWAGTAQLPLEPSRSFRPWAVKVPLDERTRAMLLQGTGDGSLEVELLACWAATLWRRTGDQVMLGYIHDGRRHEVLSRALGLLSRRLPLQVPLSPEQSFADLVEVMRQVREEAVRWQDFLDPEAGPFCNAVLPQFEIRSYPGPIQAGGVTFSVLSSQTMADLFSVKLFCELRDGGLNLELQHDAALWPVIEATQLAGQLAALIANALASPVTAVADLKLLSEAGRWWLVNDINDTDVSSVGGLCVHRLIEESAKCFPDSVALSGEGWSMSFGELEARANRLAHHLCRLGVAPEVRVALSAERSSDLVIATLAILKSGGVLVLLDPSYPEDWRDRLLMDCAPSIILTQSTVTRMTGPGREILLDRDVDRWQRESEAPPAVEVEPAHAAYILYTSGSTGTPKGVIVSHAALTNHLRWLQAANPLTASDCALLKTPVGFDVAVRELFWPLVAGARLVIAKPGGQRDASYLAGLMARQQVTLLNTVPSLLQALLDEPEIAACRALRLVFCGGEEMPVALHDWTLSRLPAQLYNQYGPTETTITALRHRCHPDERLKRVPIGRPIANVRAYVLDVRLQPLPPGIAGELYLAGAGLSRGYLGFPDLTAERFVPDPFGSGNGGRLYRTGDRVRYRTDGEIEFLGRTDQQVKIRGVRIEPSEVEAVLTTHPAVRETAVATWGEGAAKHLVAYVALWPVLAPAAGELERFALERLPEAMRPAAWIILPELPRLSSGKLDRHALPPPTARSSGSAPRTETETWLATIWSEVLKGPVSGSEDNFFTLGGSSLSGARLIARVRDVLGVELPLREIFEAPTLSGLAGRIEARLHGGTVACAPIRRVLRQEVIPLSFSQQRLWFLDRLAPDSPDYNIPAGARLRGRLDVAALSRALSSLIRRHEALRTVFPERSGQPFQVILPPSDCALPVVDLGGLDSESREEEAMRLAIEEARRPFSLDQGPLLRSFLLRLAPGEHLLASTLHHIVSDGWSRGVFVRELATSYKIFANRERSSLPDLPLQYADFAIWQRQNLGEPVLRGDLAYWTERLGQRPTALRLPTDRPRPAIRRGRGRRQPWALPGVLSGALVDLGRSQGCTLFMTLLAAFQTLLLRYTGQSRIPVGSPVSGRDRVELEPLIGFFVNTLVMVTDLGDDPPFSELLGRVRETVLEAWAHRSLPFEQLVEELQPQRDLAFTPLFQVVFVLQNTPQEEPRLPGLEVTPLELDTGTSKFDLTLTLSETPEGLRGSLEHDTDLLEPATIDRLAGHLEALLCGIVASSGTRLHDLPLLGESERAQLLVFSNASPQVNPSVSPLHVLFEARAMCDPDAIAVACEGGFLTYGELEKRANRLAHLLVARGVRLETPVGLLLEPSAELLVAILAVLKAGGTYVPLDPASPPDRLAGMLHDVEAPLLITDERPATMLPACGLEILRLGLVQSRLAEPPDRALRVDVPPGALAYVVFTSGSTGRPKGVAVTHANVVRLFAATRPWVEPDATDVWALFHSQAFDFSVWEIWGALLFGGRLAIVPSMTRRSPDALLAFLREHGVTVLSQTPSAFRQLVRVQDEGGAEVHPLRLVVLGGEALDPRSLRSWLARYGEGPPRVANMYGITETTVHVTWRPLRTADLETAASPIGVPIPDLAVHLLDSKQRFVPIGVPGEIFVGGAGLARGYLGRPDLSAERFVPDPFSGGLGARLYRSGDLARRLPSGELEYLGRTDNQVKVRGFRIEPAEIEAALAASPDVSECVVLAQEDSSSHRSLVAYFVPRANLRPTVDALREHLRLLLPEPMIPAVFVLLDALPLTPNGKLDRSALTVARHLRPNLEPSYTAPADEIEEVLAGVWTQVLDLAEVGVLDNFFSLGGDSILSLRVQSLARERGLDFALQDLFQHQTIRDLARRVRSRSEEMPDQEVVGPFGLLSPADRERLPPDIEDAYPLTAMQSGMLYHMSYTPDEIVYHNVYSYDLRLGFDPSAFAEALAQVQARHAILRTSFDLTSYSEPMQIVHPAAPLSLQTADLSPLVPAEQDKVLRAFLEEEKRTRFDLSRPPLVRLRLCRRSDETVNLIFTEFHPIFDGWSLHSFLAELCDGYLALLKGHGRPDSPPPRLSVRDFVHLERQALESRECRKYWDERLSGYNLLDLPRWQGTLPIDGHGRIRHLGYVFPPDLFEGGKRLARSQAVPVKSVLLAAHLKVLSLLGGADVLTGLVVSGRPEGPDADLVLGLFFNSVPFRLMVEGGTWSALVRSTFEGEREMLPFRRYPLAQMQKSHGGRPLFEILFNYIHFYNLAGVLNEVGLQTDFGKWEETNLPLSVSCEQDALSRRLRLSLRYDARDFAAPQMEAILRLYQRVLHDMIESPEALHDRRSFLDDETRHRLLFEWNQARPLAPLARGVYDLFAQQALRTPDAVAVVCDGERLTYAELSRRVRRIAVSLRQAGVGPEVRVGLYMRRSVDLVAALLGVLAAGGAYLPLDPLYPQERLTFILEDSGARLLLTHGALETPSLTGTTLLHLETLSGEAEGTEEEAPSHLESGFAAYLLYTSGSTGHPKGVVVEHRQILAYLDGILDRLPSPAGRGFALISTFAADLGNTVLFSSLCFGGCLHVVPEEHAYDPECLADYFSRHPIDVLKIVPSHLAALITCSRPEGILPREMLVLGGEACEWSLIRKIASLAPGCRILNHYGPTETTIGVSTFPLEVGASRADSVTVPIGQPLAGSRFYVLGPDLHLAFPGGRGELYIGGRGVSRGYLNRPALMAERFVPDPFADLPGERLYRTGDMVRWLSDGCLEFLGRRDHQVKIRGFRVELAEIEAALRKHPDLREVAVAVHRDAAGELRVAAFVVFAPSVSPDIASLRGFLRRSLPDYMVPSAFVPLSSLPRTANGKIDVRLLPPPGEAALSGRTDYQPPRSELERTLAELWMQVLQVDGVGVDDNFFDLGGHSLFMLRMHSKLRAALDPELSMATLFEYPTIASLARHLAGRQEKPPELLKPEERAEARRRSLRAMAELRTSEGS